MGIYTFALIYTIHKYEASIKQYKETIGDYKRALNLSKNQQKDDHYIWLQLEEARNSYSNMAELARQYNENWNKAQDEADFYKTAYNSEHESIHIELDNNDALKAQIKTMQEELGYLRNKARIEYESHTYKSNTYDSSGYEKLIEL